MTPPITPQMLSSVDGEQETAEQEHALVVIRMNALHPKLGHEQVMFDKSVECLPHPFGLCPSWGVWWSERGPVIFGAELVYGDRHWHQVADLIDKMHAAGMHLKIRVFSGMEGFDVDWVKPGISDASATLVNLDSFDPSLLSLAGVHVWKSAAFTYWMACRPPAAGGTIAKECTFSTLYGGSSRAFFTLKSGEGLTYTSTYGFGPSGKGLEGRTASFNELLASSAAFHLASHAEHSPLSRDSPFNVRPGEA